MKTQHRNGRAFRRLRRRDTWVLYWGGTPDSFYYEELRRPVTVEDTTKLMTGYIGRFDRFKIIEGWK